MRGPPAVARHEAGRSRQVAAGAVPPQREPVAPHSERLPVIGKVAHGRMAVLQAGRKRILRGKPVIDARHDRADLGGDSPGDAVTAVEASLDERAAVQIYDTGTRRLRALRAVDPYRDLSALRRRARDHGVLHHHPGGTIPSQPHSVGVPGRTQLAEIGRLSDRPLCCDQLIHVGVDVECRRHRNLPARSVPRWPFRRTTPVALCLRGRAVIVTFPPSPFRRSPSFCPLDSHPRRLELN